MFRIRRLLVLCYLMTGLKAFVPYKPESKEDKTKKVYKDDEEKGLNVFLGRMNTYMYVIYKDVLTKGELSHEPECTM